MNHDNDMMLMLMAGAHHPVFDTEPFQAAAAEVSQLVL
jgi:hypothetical protein